MNKNLFCDWSLAYIRLSEYKQNYSAKNTENIKLYLIFKIG